MGYKNLGARKKDEGLLARAASLEFLGGGRLIICFLLFSSTTTKGLPSLKVEDRRQQQQNKN